MLNGDFRVHLYKEHNPFAVTWCKFQATLIEFHLITLDLLDRVVQGAQAADLDEAVV